MSFADKLRELRTEKGISQKKLAEKAGLSQAAIYQWEKGTRNPRIETIQKIAEALGVKSWDLIGVDRKAAVNEWIDVEFGGKVISDEKKRKEYGLLKEIVEQESEDTWKHYNTFVNPVLEFCGYGRFYMEYNGKRTIAFWNSEKEREISYEDAEDAISTALYLADYLLNKKSSDLTPFVKGKIRERRKANGGKEEEEKE